MTTPVTWFELTGTDTAALRTFYADLFGWEITPVDGMDYGIVAAGDGGIGGGITAGDGQLTAVTAIRCGGTARRGRPTGRR